MKTKFIEIPATGYSMYPFFIPGDIIYVKLTPFADIKVDDFVTFVKNNKIITHRVIYLSPDKKYLISKGDRNALSDGKISSKNILGIVTKIKRNATIYPIDSLYQLQSSLYIREVTLLIKQLTKAEIDFVLLKGLPVHLYFEKKIPRRIYGDCDILVRKSDLAKTHTVLRKLGYANPVVSFSKVHKLLKDKETEIEYRKTIHLIPINIDLHVEASFMMHQIGSLDSLYSEELLDSFSAQLLHRKQTMTVNGIRYPILDQSGLIVYLALHLLHHNLKGYYRYEMLRMVLQRKDIKIEDIVSLIHKYNVQNFVWPVFYILTKRYKNQPAAKILSLIEIPKSKKNEIGKEIATLDIFSDDSRLKAGIMRFKMLYMLSPNPTYKKIAVFLSPAVLYSIFWVFVKKSHGYFLQLKRPLHFANNIAPSTRKDFTSIN
jgi:signal peptidase I